MRGAGAVSFPRGSVHTHSLWVRLSLTQSSLHSPGGVRREEEREEVTETSRSPQVTPEGRSQMNLL